MINVSIDKAMSMLRSFGDINPTLTQCRQYFESMMPWAVNRNATLDTQNMSAFRLPTNLHFQPLAMPGSRSIAHMMHPPGSLDYQGHDLGQLNLDQRMADYPAELFADASFGGFNFNALDSIIQL